jgi:hypothetical protein
MHEFTRGFGFCLHFNFCFLSKVATTGPFLHLHFRFFSLLSDQSLLFSFHAPLSCEPTFVFFFFFSHLVLEKECIGCVAFEKSMGRCLFPHMLYGNFPKVLPLPTCKIFKTIIVVKFSKLPLMPSCKVFKTSTSYM